MKSFGTPGTYHYKDLYYVKQRILRRRHQLKTVLDIGCCGTVYPHLFDLKGTLYTAVDISEISILRMKKIYPDENIRWDVSDICDLECIDDASIDLILATQIFEHLSNPELALEVCISKLRKGGLLLIGTEASLFNQMPVGGVLMKLVTVLSLHLGAVYLVYGQAPCLLPHREDHSFVDAGNSPHIAEVVHGYYHPRYFEWIIKQEHLQACVNYLRVSGSFSDNFITRKFGSQLAFRWLDIKAVIPVLKYLGSQLFIEIEKTS